MKSKTTKFLFKVTDFLLKTKETKKKQAKFLISFLGKKNSETVLKPIEEINSLPKLIQEIKTQFKLQGECKIRYYDEDFEEWLNITSWEDLPVQKAQSIKIEVTVKEQIKLMTPLIQSTILQKDIQDQLTNELILYRESSSKSQGSMALHPINFARMRDEASPKECCPVISFIGPAGSGKSSLLRQLNPTPLPVTAIPTQSIPTSSNITSYFINGPPEIPKLRCLDIEGEDGGFPLIEYCKNFGLNFNSLGPENIFEIVKNVSEKCTPSELHDYMEGRKNVTKRSFSRLAYIMSDIVIYVNTVPSHRQGEYLTALLDFASLAENKISSVERPSLICVFNQCKKKDEPFDIDSSTEQLLSFMDKRVRLLETFRTIDFVKIPDWQFTELFHNQFRAFQDRLFKRIKESKESREKNGTLFSARDWFQILQTILMNFDAPYLSMSEIYSRLIISQNELVNRAYQYFNFIYGHLHDKKRFINCRQISIKMLAFFIAIETKNNDYLEKSLFEDLLMKINRRAPCEAKFQGKSCSQERAVHNSHRFVGDSSESTRLRSYTEGIKAVHIFDDSVKPSQLYDLFSHCLKDFKKLTSIEIKKKRTELFKEGKKSGFLIEVDWRISDSQKHLPSKCFLCMKGSRDALLTCGHSLCRRCIKDYGSFLSFPYTSVQCPLCEVECLVVENNVSLPTNSGIRVLSLDGCGFRIVIQFRILEHLLKLIQLNIDEAFDVICGTGVSGFLPLSIIHGKKIDQFKHLLDKLPTTLQEDSKFSFKRMVTSLTTSQVALDHILKDYFGDKDLSENALRNTLPKGFVVSGDANSFSTPIIIGNYPGGFRETPKVNIFLHFWEAAKASSAFPSVFGLFAKYKQSFIDGSIYTPNPSELGIIESRLIWKYSKPIDLFLSIGSGLKPKKENDETALTYMGENIDIAELCNEVHEKVQRILVNPSEYIRIDPDLKGDRGVLFPRKTFQTLIEKIDLWITQHPERLKFISQQILSKVYILETFPASLENISLGQTVQLSVSSRISSKSAEKVACQLKVSINFYTTSFTKVAVTHTINQKSIDSWTIQFSIDNPGMYECKLLLEQPSTKYSSSISGSPLYFSSTKAPISVPEENYIPFEVFMDQALSSSTEPDQNARLDQRLLQYGIIESFNSSYNSPKLSVFQSASQQLFNSFNFAWYIQKSVAGWLKQHSTFLFNKKTLEEHVENWDEYCSKIEDGTHSIDHYCILALAYSLQIRIVIVTSLVGQKFLTEIKPPRWTRNSPIVIAHSRSFGYIGVLLNNDDIIIFHPTENKGKRKREKEEEEKLNFDEPTSPGEQSHSQEENLFGSFRKTSSKLSQLKKRASGKIQTYNPFRSADWAPEIETAHLEVKRDKREDLKLEDITRSTSANLNGNINNRNNNEDLNNENNNNNETPSQNEDPSKPEEPLNSKKQVNTPKDRRWGSLRKASTQGDQVKLKKSSSSDSLTIQTPVTRLRSKSLVKKSKIYSLDFLPHELFNSKFNARENWQLVGPNCILCSYKNTTAKVIGFIDSKEQLVLLTELNQRINVQQIIYPYLFYGLEDGSVVSYDLRTAGKINQVWIDNNEAAYWKEASPLAILVDEKYLVTIRKGGLTSVFDRNSGQSVTPPLFQTVCSFKKNSQHIQQKNCILRYPKLLIATHFSFQIWNLQEKTVEFEGELPNKTTSISHLIWSQKENSIIWIIASDSILVFDTKKALSSLNLSPNSSSTSEKPLQTVQTEVPITAVAAHEKFVVYGDRVGNLMIRDWKGSLLGVLHEVETQITDLNNFDNGHKDKKIEVWKWDEINKTGEILDMFPTTGPITHMVFDNAYIVATVGSQISPTVLYWLPKITF